MKPDNSILAFGGTIVLGLWVNTYLSALSSWQVILNLLAATPVAFLVAWIAWEWKSVAARERRDRKKRALEIPSCIRLPSDNAVKMGQERDLQLPLYLPDHVRSRHVHVLGATGSGKTESVVLNFLRQDVVRGLGAIVLDAKGDSSFLTELETWVPQNRLGVFDLTSPDSTPFNPLSMGNHFEAAQRLFASLNWSQEYYKSKALSALQQLFDVHSKTHGKNPSIAELADYLRTQKTFGAIATPRGYSDEQVAKDFAELSGLRDQLRSLSCGHLKDLLSPTAVPSLRIEEASEGKVLYFRLQSLLSPQVVSSVGKLLINCLSYLAGTAHRTKAAEGPRMVPVYLDEFASFACPEFADLISKARSAGFALHFSHQSVGDLMEVSKGFLNQITDNSATKIVLRINDPDTAEFFSRAFGTQATRKFTQRVTNAKDTSSAEVEGEASMREVLQFRAPPDLFKTLPTGEAAVLVTHGEDTPHGASTVFRIQFPRLKGAP